ncbi:MAG: IPT/TIG domain-containing protein [Bacteroidetes bacterium]|nr:IPT/TIG domain-containing protein [Bacteroidota bacterium]MCY4204435.1 IPT/TIG domain-containing protein [Bacteroidota bacterium]
MSFGCDSGTAPSIYDPDRASLPTPVIEGIMPEDRALAGVDDVIITGSNFSTQPADNLVYFGSTRADVLESTSTQLRLLAPNDPQPELNLRLVVVGAENFSNSISYRLDPPFIEFGEVKDFEDIYGIATDPSGNVYVSLVAFSIPVGIIRITPEGERSEFINSPFLWTDFTFGLNNDLYGVRSVRAVFRSQDGSNNFSVFAVIPDRAVRLTAIAIDTNNRLWVAGDNQEIYRILSDGTVKGFKFEADVKDLVALGDYLYLTAIQNQSSKIWRFMIDSSGELGVAEEVFDLTTFNSSEGHALAFSASGNLYVGTSERTDSIVLLDTGGDAQVLYPGVLAQAARRFAWGQGGHLYAATNSTENSVAGIIRITTRN